MKKHYTTITKTGFSFDILPRLTLWRYIDRKSFTIAWLKWSVTFTNDKI